MARSAWRHVADPLPLGTPGVTPVTGRRTVSRAFERGPETRRVLPGIEGIPGMQAQLASPMGTATPDFSVLAGTMPFTPAAGSWSISPNVPGPITPTSPPPALPPRTPPPKTGPIPR